MWYVSKFPSVANQYSQVARRNMNIASSNTVSKPRWNWPPLHAAHHSLKSSTARTGAEHLLDVLESAVNGLQVLPSSSPTLLSVFLDFVSIIKLTSFSISSKSRDSQTPSLSPSSRSLPPRLTIAQTSDTQQIRTSHRCNLRISGCLRAHWT
jgi:hypothetical protein